MTINSYDHDLQKLREAASAGKWMERVEPRMRLLSALGITETLKLTIQVLDTYLAKARQTHGEQEWTEKYLKLIKDVSASGEFDELRANQIPLEHSERFPKHLAYIIAELRYIVLNMGDAKKAIEEASELIPRIFMMEIADQMNNITPETSRPSTNGPVEIQKFMNRNVMDGIRLRNRPEVANLEVSLWLGFADEIEKRLKSP